MAVLKTRDDVKNWLEKAPREVAIVFAARVALRVTPLLNSLFLSKMKAPEMQAIILPLFYGKVTALFEGRWPNRAVDTFAAARAATAAARAATAADAADAATAAALAAFAAAHATAARAAAHAADAARAATAADAAAVDIKVLWREFNRDYDFIKSGGNASALANEPLWLDGWQGAPKSVRQDWQKLKRRLIDAKQDWEVWTDWYENRVIGGWVKDGPDLELAKLDYLSKHHKDGPAVVNAELLRITKAFYDEKDKENLPPPPEQDVTGETFGPNEAGAIDFTTVQTSSNLIDTPDQRLRYAELRRNVERLIKESANLLGEAKSDLTDLYNVLPTDISEALIVPISARGNNLRVLVELHDLAIKEEPEGPYLHKLSPAVAASVNKIVTQFNKLAFHDPGMRAEDEAGVSPRNREETQETLEIVRPILSEDLKPFSSDGVNAFIDEVYRQNRIMGRTSAQDIEHHKNRKSVNNLIAYLLRFADNCVRKDGKIDVVNTAATIRILTFLWKRSVALIAFVKRTWPWFEEGAKQLFRVLPF